LELKVFKKMLGRGACFASSDRSPTFCLAIANFWSTMMTSVTADLQMIIGEL
jgi:hypothetical protein